MISENQARTLIVSYIKRYIDYRARNDAENARRMRYECCVVYALCSEEKFDELAG